MAYTHISRLTRIARRAKKLRMLDFDALDNIIAQAHACFVDMFGETNRFLAQLDLIQFAPDFDIIRSELISGNHPDSSLFNLQLKAWRDGIDALVEICHAAAVTAESASNASTLSDGGQSPPTVLLITATDVEARAVLAAFEDATGDRHEIEQRGDHGLFYRLGQVGSAIVFMVESGMGSLGTGGSINTVIHGIEALSPVAVIMLGIAFGLKQGNQSIGDIIVATRLICYESQRVGTGPDGERRIYQRGAQPETSSRLVRVFRAAHKDWNRSAMWFGPLLSGEKLVDNLDYREGLHALAPEAEGGEMEGNGLYSAAQDRGREWILAKAICDWADGHKVVDKETRQRFAAANAAGLTLLAVRHGWPKLNR